MSLMKKLLSIIIVLVVTGFTPVYGDMVNGETVNEIDWDVLMPADYYPGAVFDISQFGSLDDYDPMAEIKLKMMMEALSSAPVVQEMDGKMVRIPGFVVPLVEEGLRVTEFFLVPYFGACIHVPPPPSNQMLYVTFEPGANVENLYDAIWITGKLSVTRVAHDLGTAGYKVEAFKIEPYDE